jgi:predicted nucleic acid-binding protein
MTAFVLDNSVAMRWLLSSNRPTDQNYAEAVLESLTGAEAIVPNLWHLEAANVLLGAAARKEIEVAEAERFTVQLEKLPIMVDTSTANQAFSHTMSLARAYKLSSYDAAYLELALREGIAIATLNSALAKAAVKAGIGIYLK